jgi:Flp pilus assembly protein TadG
MVEFAIVLPLLAMILLGIFNGGLLMSRRESITHAVREGARYGATLPKDQCTAVVNCGGSTWAQLVRSIVVERSEGDLTTACVALVTGSGSGSTPPSAVDASHTTAGGTNGCYVDHSADTGLRVQVTATRPDKMQAMLVHFTVNLSSKATAKFEQ